jgi:hypothetical protein
MEAQLAAFLMVCGNKGSLGGAAGKRQGKQRCGTKNQSSHSL